MLIKVGLELYEQGRALAWALDFPGCFAYGKDGSEAVIAMPGAVVAYEAWVNRRAGVERLSVGDFDVRLVETWQVYTINEQYDLTKDGYEVESWFRNDWKPLRADDVAFGLDLLRWTRHDLLHTIAGLSDAQLDQERAGERWSIRGILRHIANAEWWYLDRLGLAEQTREALPQDVHQRMEVVRRRLERVLPDLQEKEQVVGKDGEFWSPRKLLRRAVWHEVDHMQHILKLIYT